MTSKFIALVGTAIALGSFSPALAQLRPGPIILAPKVSLACKNPGTHQDVAKTPIITNTTSSSIPAGKTIYWNASDGDKGTVSVNVPLAAGSSVQGLGSAGNAYTCTAYYYL